MSLRSDAGIVREIRAIAAANLAALDPYLSQLGGTAESRCAADLEQEIEDCDIWLGGGPRIAPVLAGEARRRIDRQIRDHRAAGA